MVLGKVLLLAHAVAAAVLVGASTHLAVQAVALLRGRARPRLLRLYPRVALVAWATTAALGAYLYPRYRVEVRDAWLDARAVWASVLFDIKENLALFVGPLLLAAALLGGRVVTDPDRALRRWFLATCVSAGAIAWCNALAGLLVASVRSL